MSTSSPRFHVDREHAQRATGPLPFGTSAELHALVSESLAAARMQAGSGPAENPYALQSDTLAFLGALLRRLSPRSVVEFGSGVSTGFFARWAAEHGARLVSIEHDRGWVKRVGDELPDETRAAVDLRHAPLRLTRRGLRLFLTYGGLSQLREAVRGADLVLNDGPHMSGRELVLYTVLTSCRPGTTVVLDDYRHYAVREMLGGVAPSLAACFAGEAVDDNSHGLYVLRCLKPAVEARVPNLGLSAILRSYWRCLRDFRQHGTGA